MLYRFRLRATVIAAHLAEVRVEGPVRDVDDEFVSAAFNMMAHNLARLAAKLDAERIEIFQVCLQRC